MLSLASVTVTLRRQATLWAVAGLLAFSCGGETQGGPSVATTTEAGVGSTAAPSSDDGGEGTPVFADSGLAIDSGDTTCAGSATAGECGFCCGIHDDHGGERWNDAIRACECQTNHCIADCHATLNGDVSFCAGGTISPLDGTDLCANCVQQDLDAGDAGCLAPLLAGCTTDLACVTYLRCLANCATRTP